MQFSHWHQGRHFISLHAASSGTTKCYSWIQGNVHLWTLVDFCFFLFPALITISWPLRFISRPHVRASFHRFGTLTDTYRHFLFEDRMVCENLILIQYCGKLHCCLLLKMWNFRHHTRNLIGFKAAEYRINTKLISTSTFSKTSTVFGKGDVILMSVQRSKKSCVIK